MKGCRRYCSAGDMKGHFSLLMPGHLIRFVADLCTVIALLWLKWKQITCKISPSGKVFLEAGLDWLRLILKKCDLQLVGKFVKIFKEKTVFVVAAGNCIGFQYKETRNYIWNNLYLI